MLSINRSLTEIMQDMLERASSITLTDGTTMALTPGSVARLLMGCISAEFEIAYNDLEAIHLQSFLSTASGIYLDLIGQLVNCTRLTDEEDNNFKARISAQVTVLETSNELAVRMSILTIEGVSDVIFRKYTYGCGSFTAFVITSLASEQEEVVAKCEEAISSVIAYGNRFSVEIPTLVPIEIGIKIIYKTTATATEHIRSAALEAIREYINTRTVGESIIINEIIEKCMSLSDDVYDINIFNLKVDGVKTEVANQQCRSDERFIEASIPNAVYIV